MNLNNHEWLGATVLGRATLKLQVSALMEGFQGAQSADRRCSEPTQINLRDAREGAPWDTLEAKDPSQTLESTGQLNETTSY